MNRGPRWSVVALLVALGALAHERALAWLAPLDPMAMAFYRIAVVTLAAGGFALAVLPRRRLAYLLAALTCFALVGYALYLQYVQGLEPCPLCFFQRLAVIALAFVFLAAAVHDPGRVGAWIYAIAAALFGGTGAALAARHVWIQFLPADRVPASCGMGIEYMLDTLPLFDVVRRVLSGSGECAEKDWAFLGLTLPGWTLVFFVALTLVAFGAAARRR